MLFQDGRLYPPKKRALVDNMSWRFRQITFPLPYKQRQSRKKYIGPLHWLSDIRTQYQCKKVKVMEGCGTSLVNHP